MLSATLSPETQRYKRSIYCPFGSGTQPTRLKRLYEENRLGMFFIFPARHESQPMVFSLGNGR